jgi:hypothetical protein
MADTPAPQELPPPPGKPLPYECCGRHCSPCIFDYYRDAMARWDQAVRALGEDPDAVLASLGRVR